MIMDCDFKDKRLIKVHLVLMILSWQTQVLIFYHNSGSFIIFYHNPELAWERAPLYGARNEQVSECGLPRAQWEAPI